MTSKNMTGRELCQTGKTVSLLPLDPVSHHGALLLWCHSLFVLWWKCHASPLYAQKALSVLYVVHKKLKKKSACVPSMSELWVSSSPLWLGNHFASLHGHLHLQHGSSQEETQSHKLMESSPTLTGLLEPSLLWTLGSESDFCEMVGCPTVTTLRDLLAWQKWQLIKRPVWRVGSREPSKSCPTLNS